MQQSHELSPQEREVIVLVAEGKTNAEIAKATGLTPGTVKAYLEKIRLKTGTGNKVEMTNWWNAHKDQG
jgi:DNA-binding CsgD family transcriptional regulator